MESHRDQLHRLLAPLHEDLRALARNLSRSSDEGDETFQEAALKALRKIDDLRDESAFRAWFCRILITVHRSRARRSFWKRAMPIGDRDVAAPSTDTGGAERARQALARLAAPVREAVVMYEIEGFTVDEIAELQGASTSAVKSRLARGRTRLRDIYRKRFGVGRAAPRAELARGDTP